ncbi:hypothetical protein BC938DRAFT_474184 [Jimgerdemannia flammicorona]|uniref:Uncharacterized protein n=1 Tax=Jimgerdemannia flammicorona TaxID=994334 RepID=A0A433Q2M0_9FUNG|nr:hypothetical protein BC938DRAFT_474184 [Jimgerdemannia flammicorona]
MAKSKAAQTTTQQSLQLLTHPLGGHLALLHAEPPCRVRNLVRYFVLAGRCRRARGASPGSMQQVWRRIRYGDRQMHHNVPSVFPGLRISHLRRSLPIPHLARHQ